MKPDIKPVMVHGKLRFQINLGKRITGGEKYARKFFKSERAARKYLASVLKQSSKANLEFLNLAEKVRVALMAFYRLTVAKQMSVESAYDVLSRLELSESGETLPKPQLLVELAVTEFIEDRKEQNLDLGTVREYTSQLRRFARAFKGRDLSSIAKQELMVWIRSMQLGDRTRRNYVTSLRTFFTFWITEDAILKNPAEHVPKPKIRKKRPILLPFNVLCNFIELVCREAPELIGPMAFALFAGIRVKEISLLDWSDVNLPKKIFVVPDSAGKGQRGREFAISEQFAAWLHFCPDKSGPIMKFSSLDAYWKRRKEVYRKAGIEKMPPNVFRKMFSTCDWSIDRDTKRLCAQLGNAPEVAMRFYIDRTLSTDEGQRFKALLPRQSSISSEWMIFGPPFRG